MTTEKMYIWTGNATMGGSHTFIGPASRNVAFTVLAPAREEAIEAIRDLLNGQNGIHDWVCNFASIQEVYARAQVVEHREEKA